MEHFEHSEVYNAFVHIKQNYYETMISSSKSDQKMVANLLGDLIMHDVKAKNIAITAANMGTLAELTHIADLDEYEQNLQFSKLHKKLVDTYGFDVNVSETVLAVFIYSFGITGVRPVSEIDAYLEELDKLPIEEKKCITCMNARIPDLYIAGESADDILETCIRATRYYKLKWDQPIESILEEDKLQLILCNRINDRGVILKLLIHHVGEGRGKISTEIFKQSKSGKTFSSVGNAKDVKILLEEIVNNQSDNDVRKQYREFLSKCKKSEKVKLAREAELLKQKIHECNINYIKQYEDMEYAEAEILLDSPYTKVPTIKEAFNYINEENRKWFLLSVDRPVGSYTEKTKTYESVARGMFIRIKVIEKPDKYGGSKIRYIVSFNPMYDISGESSCSYDEYPGKYAVTLSKLALSVHKKQVTENKPTTLSRNKEFVDKAYTPSELFEANDCYIVDKRYADGCLWVMGDLQVLKKCAAIVEKNWGIKGHFGSGKVSHYKQAWFTRDERYDEVEERGAEIRRKKREEERENAMEIITFTRKDILDGKKTKYYPVSDLFHAFWEDKECFNRICNKHDVKPEVIELLNDVASKESDYLKAKVIIASRTKTHLSEYDLEKAVYKHLVSTTEREIETSFWWKRTIVVTATYKGVVVGEYTRSESRK